MSSLIDLIWVPIVFVLLVGGLILLLTSCDDSYVSPAQCDVPCYSGPEWTLKHGMCRRGSPVCDEHGTVLRCDGEILPTHETCNGIDDNCDGSIDNDARDSEIGQWCGGPAHGEGTACRLGAVRCVGGELACVGAVGPFPEACNGIDDDCNGAPDDLPILGTCYGGDPVELLAGGACRAGVTLCMGGEHVCLGEVRSSEEVCNGEDDDCDGSADEAPEGQLGFVDFVLHLDRSGSFSDEVAIAEEGLALFLLEHADDAYRFAIVDVPGEVDGEYALRLDLSDALTAMRAVCPYDLGSGGAEPTYDALYDAATGRIPISWRPGSTRAHILLTDEVWISPRGTDESETAEAFAESGDYFFAIAVGVAYAYDEIAQASGGEVFSDIRDALRLSELVRVPAGSVCE